MLFAYSGVILVTFAASSMLLLLYAMIFARKEEHVVRAIPRSLGKVFVYIFAATIFLAGVYLGQHHQ